MQFITTVTQKGQITLPKNFRDLLNIKSYDQVKVIFSNEKIIVEPIDDIMTLAGKYKSKAKHKIDPVKARELMESNYKRF